MTARNPPNLWSFARQFAETGEDSEKNRRDGNSPVVAHPQGVNALVERRGDADGTSAREAVMSKRAVLERWVVDRYRVVIGVVRKKWGGKIDGGDVVQEVARRMLDSSRDLPSDAKDLDRYLFGVVRHVALEMARKGRFGHEEVTNDIEDVNSLQWEKEMEEFQEAERIRKALDAKATESEAWAEAIRVWERNRLEKRSIPQTCDETGLSDSTVDRRIRKVEEWLERTFRQGGGRS